MTEKNPHQSAIKLVRFFTVDVDVMVSTKRERRRERERNRISINVFVTARSVKIVKHSVMK